MRESDSKCCGECATGECGNLDRIAALERELAETKRDWDEASDERSEEIDRLKQERDEAHAAIRAYKQDHDEDYQFAAQGSTCDCMICSDHALTICRASEGE